MSTGPCAILPTRTRATNIRPAGEGLVHDQGLDPKCDGEGFRCSWQLGKVSGAGERSKVPSQQTAELGMVGHVVRHDCDVRPRWGPVPRKLLRECIDRRVDDAEIGARISQSGAAPLGCGGVAAS